MNAVKSVDNCNGIICTVLKSYADKASMLRWCYRYDVVLIGIELY